MRTLILSQYYHPEPVPKPVELALELKRRGHVVSVLTGFPNYPAGKLYPGFRLLPLKREKSGNVDIIRAFEYPYHGRRVMGRILNYASFMFSAVPASFFARPCDILYVWHPPLTIGVAAWLIARVRKVPFVYDVQDIWPDSAVLSGLLEEKGRLVRWMGLLERFIYRRANHILVNTGGTRERLTAKGVPTKKISVVSNWVDEALFALPDRQGVQEARRRLGWGDRFVVLFAGNIGLVQGLDTLVSAAKQLNAEDILFSIVGDGVDKPRLQDLARARGVSDRIQFIGRQPLEKMPLFMGAADLLLVHLKKSELSRSIIPTKTLAYLAAGKPVLMAMEGQAADLIRRIGAGVDVEPDNPTSMAEAICRMFNMDLAEREGMGRRGREFLLENFSKNGLVPKYEAIFQQVLDSEEKGVK